MTKYLGCNAFLTLVDLISIYSQSVYQLSGYAWSLEQDIQRSKIFECNQKQVTKKHGSSIGWRFIVSHSA